MATETSRRSTLYRLATPFWNATEERPRALWRVLGAFVLVVAVASAVASVVVEFLASSQYLDGLVAQAVYALTTLGVLVVWARYVDRRPLAAYGFHPDRTWGRDLAVGAGIGLLAWGGALATDLLAGWASVESVLSAGTVGLPLAVGLTVGVAQFALVGLWEELLFRGIVLRNAVEGLGWLSRRGALAGGLVVSSLVFGVLHADQAGSVLALGFWVFAGLVMGAAYLWTGELAAPVGLHLAFDVSVNHVYGLFAVRAAALPYEPPTLVRPAFSGPDAFVGIAGLVNTGWLLVVAVAVLAYARARNGSFDPPFATEYDPDR